MDARKHRPRSSGIAVCKARRNISQCSSIEMDAFQTIEQHFERVALIYPHVRNTDPDIIERIVARLPRENLPMKVADIGCGSGRYPLILAARLCQNLLLFCSDHSSAMIANCRRRITKGSPFHHVSFCRTSATTLPYTDGCLDAVVTLNAVHHFDLDRFLAEVARVLRRGGLLAIYTRTPEQNARTVWARHFPGFTKHETRLYAREHLEKTVGGISGLQLEDLLELKHVRVESRESLLQRARHFHYSTFALYSPGEFTNALQKFARRLTVVARAGTITHTAENTLVFARRV